MAEAAAVDLAAPEVTEAAAAEDSEDSEVQVVPAESEDSEDSEVQVVPAESEDSEDLAVQAEAVAHPGNALPDQEK